MKRIVIFLLLIEAVLLISCQKDEPVVANLGNLTDDSNPGLKSTPNTANLDQLLIIIAEKVQSGEISKGHGNALTTKVNSAKNNIAKGQLQAAENVLNAFNNQVNSLVTEGTISAELGQVLTKKADEVFHPRPWACGDNFTDARDDHSYKSVQMGSQCWMSENLAYLPSVHNPLIERSKIEPFMYVIGYHGNDRVYAKTLGTYINYGVLYNWTAAMNNEESSEANPSGVQGICPDGWHIPSRAEWLELSQFIVDYMNTGYNMVGTSDLWGYAEGVGGHLKSKEGWLEDANGTDDFGFNALPCGSNSNWGNYPGEFGEFGKFSHFWTSVGDRNAIYMAGTPRLYWSNGDKQDGYSVRCIQDK